MYRKVLALSLFIIICCLIPRGKADGQTIECSEPNILVLFDSSGSLGTKANPDSNYNKAVDALLTVTSSYQSLVRFGLLVFPAAPNVSRCETTSTLTVPIALNNHNAFETFFNGFGGPTSYSDTPMLQVFNRVYTADSSDGNIYEIKTTERRNYLVLFTDGIQDCCYDEHFSTQWAWDAEEDCNWGVPYSDPGYFDPDEANENRQELIQLVTNISNLGINVFVVGFGERVDPETLDALAVAGKTQRVPDCGVTSPWGFCYYQANNKTELSDAFAEIAQIVKVEECDGVDNDCDGNTDEDLTKDCATPCGTGFQYCDYPDWTECDAPKPVTESCDNKDNDCDGKTDEDLKRNCSTVCGTGTETCSKGVWTGCTAVKPTAEDNGVACDGIDNDCDGVTDEGCECTILGEKQSCGGSVGECKAGDRECVNYKWGPCVNATAPKAELCNNKDDDCDGVTDDFEEECSTVCGTGVRECQQGAWSECSAQKPTMEKCNDIDDDCDGQTDEDLFQVCKTKCGTGSEECVAGEWIDCSAQEPMNEICDYLDNDCDGETDEDLVRDCQTDCGKGLQGCVDGSWTECSAVEPVPEICDALDNDCDQKVDEKDEGALCEDGLECYCGGCQPPAIQNECYNGGTLIGGYCVLDNCPPGKVCDDHGVCVEGDKPGGDTSSDDVKDQPGGDTSHGEDMGGSTGADTSGDSADGATNGQHQSGVSVGGGCACKHVGDAVDFKTELYSQTALFLLIFSLFFSLRRRNRE